MTSPCPRCGATRTDSVIHGGMYKIVWMVGYRLRRCSRCRLPRFIRRHLDESPDSLRLGEEAVAPHSTEGRRSSKIAQENFQGKVTQQATGADSSNREWGCCPACGSTAYHRSRRTTLERILLRPRMARCERCRKRFPHPEYAEESPHPFQLVEEAAAVPHSTEERRTSKIAEENLEPKATKPVKGADSSNRGGGRCPACGSTAYRRSRRTTLERILLRPRMARCARCRKRFPYPKG